MQLLRHSAILLGLTAGMAFLPAPEAKAGIGTNLGACQAMAMLDTLFGGYCSIGDKEFSFDSMDYMSPKPANEVVVAIGTDPAQTIYTLNFTAIGSPNYWTQGTTMIGYTVDVIPTSTEQIASLTAGYTTSVSGTTFTYQTTGTPSVGVPGGGPCTGSASGDCTATPLLFNTPSLFVSNTMTIGSNGSTGVTQITNTITQTPGPLPILGAGAAFGFSRKLRRRIKATA